MPQGDLKIFLKKTFIFLLPLLFIFSFFDCLAIWSGELTPVLKVLKHQRENSDSDILFGRKVVDQELKKYKYLMLTNDSVDILAIGSSRILGMRKELFYPFYSFTNLGSLTHNLGDLEDLVDRLPIVNSPKIVFLAPDYYWFGEKRELASALTKELLIPGVLWQWQSHLFAARHLIFLLLGEPSKFFSYFDKENKYKESFGFQSKNGDGYRADGSYNYGTYLNELKSNYIYIDREQPSIIERVKSGSSSYAFDNRFDDNRVVLFGDILKKLKKKNYYVIGLGLPFSKEVYRELKTNLHHRELFNAYEDSMPKVFKANGFEYFDYSDLDKLGLSDLYMFDGVHSSETAVAYMLTDLLNHLKKRDIEHKDEMLLNLKKLLKKEKTNTFEIDF